MAILALVLLSIVLAEYAGTSAATWRIAAESIIATAVLTLVAHGLGFGPTVWLLVALPAVWWILARRMPLWQAVGVAAVVAWTGLLLAIAPWLDRKDPAWGDWYEAVAADHVAEVPLDNAVLAVIVFAFLIRPANAIVRIVLDRSGPGILAEELTLKGGRVLGPLERILIFGAALAGTFTIVAAVMAAKGLLRFPEVSRDDPHGLRAEYVLIGSFVSWGLAVVWTPLF